MEKEQLVTDSKFSPIHKIVKTEKGHKIVVANYQVSEETFEDAKSADNYINERPWELLLNTFMAITDFERNYKANQKKFNKQKPKKDETN